MAASVEAGAAGEQSVAVGHLAHILIGAPRSHDSPGAAVLPEIDVLLSVEGHHPLASGARGGLDADAVLQGHPHQPVGVSIPQVRLGEEGQLVQVVAGLDIRRCDPLLLHLFAVVGHVVPHMLDLLYQALVLPGLDLFPGRSLDLRLIIAFQWNHPSLVFIFLLFHAKKESKKFSAFI